MPPVSFAPPLRRVEAGPRRFVRDALIAAVCASAASCGSNDMAALVGNWAGMAHPRGQAAADASATLEFRSDGTFTVDVTTHFALTAPELAGCTETVHAVGTWIAHPSMAGDSPWISAVFMAGSSDTKSDCANPADDSAAPNSLASTNPNVFFYTVGSTSLGITLIYAYTSLGVAMAPFTLARM